MGCCQNTPPSHDSNQLNNLHKNQDGQNLENNQFQEYFDQLYQKEKYVTMVVDKLDLDIQMLITKENLIDGLFVFC